MHPPPPFLNQEFLSILAQNIQNLNNAQFRSNFIAQYGYGGEIKLTNEKTKHYASIIIEQNSIKVKLAIGNKIYKANGFQDAIYLATQYFNQPARPQYHIPVAPANYLRIPPAPVTYKPVIPTRQSQPGGLPQRYQSLDKDASNSHKTRRPKLKSLSSRGITITPENMDKIRKEFSKDPKKQKLSYKKYGILFSILKDQNNNLYAIGEPLGEGAFGKVKVGMNLETGKLVAIKKQSIKVDNQQSKQAIKDETELANSYNPEFIKGTQQRTYKEIQTSHILRNQSPNSDYKDKHYIISELGQETLQDFLLQNRSILTLENKLKIILNIIKEIENIHSKHIIHKDIKPNNMLFDKETNQVTLIDFGISQRLDNSNHATISTIFGDMAVNIAPELKYKAYINNNNKAIQCDTKVDIYSLGYLMTDFGFNITKLSSPNIIERMLSTNPVERPNLDEIKQAVEQELNSLQSSNRTTPPT